MIRRYSRQEVDDILRRALSEEHLEGGMSHDELVRIAAEVGIEPGAIEAAAEAVREANDRARVEASIRRVRRGTWWRWVGILGVTDLFLAGADLASGEGWWVQWPLLASGLLLGLFGVRVLAGPTASQIHKAVSREQTRQRSLRRAKKIDEGVSAVVDGVSRVLNPRSAASSGKGGPRVRVEGEAGEHEHEVEIGSARSRAERR